MVVISYENVTEIPIYIYTYDDMLLVGIEPNNYKPSYRVAVTISNAIPINGTEEVGVVENKTLRIRQASHLGHSSTLYHFKFYIT